MPSCLHAIVDYSTLRLDFLSYVIFIYFFWIIFLAWNKSLYLEQEGWIFLLFSNEFNLYAPWTCTNLFNYCLFYVVWPLCRKVCSAVAILRFKKMILLCFGSKLWLVKIQLKNSYLPLREVQQRMTFVATLIATWRKLRYEKRLVDLYKWPFTSFIYLGGFLPICLMWHMEKN